MDAAVFVQGSALFLSPFLDAAIPDVFSCLSVPTTSVFRSGDTLITVL